MIQKVLKSNKYAIIKAAICVALVLCVILSFTNNTDAANYVSVPYSTTGIAVQNTYMIAASTGTSADADEIVYFEVRYLDDEGFIRSELIYPKQGKEKARNMALSANNTQTKENAVSGKVKEIFNETLIQYDSSSYLKKGTTDYYLFSPVFTFKSFVDIRFYGINHGKEPFSQKKWPCSSLQVFKVDNCYGGLYDNGLGGNYTILFDGTLLAEYSGNNFTWTNPALIALSPDAKNSLYKIKTEFTEQEKKYSNLDYRYFVQIDVADVFGAGIETFNYETNSKNNNLSNIDRLNLYDSLMFQIEYTNSFGRTKNVYVPVLSAYYCAVFNSGIDRTKNIEGICQQGNTLSFEVYLDDFKQINTYRLAYSVASDTYKYIFSKMDKVAAYHSDDDLIFSYSAIRMYKAGMSKLGFDYDGVRYVSTFSSTLSPLYVNTTSSYSGSQIKRNGAQTKIVPKEYHKGGKTEARLSGNSYLVSITTDSAESAGTINDITLTIHYVKTNGLTDSTGEIKLSEACKNYYGNWPLKYSKNTTVTVGSNARYDSNGKLIGVQVKKATYYYEPVLTPAYYPNVAAGKTINFIVNCIDVKSFTGATLELNGSDEWQMKSLTIKQISSISDRKITFGDQTIKGLNSKVCVEGLVTKDYEGIKLSDFDYVTGPHTKLEGLKEISSDVIFAATNITRDCEGIDCVKYKNTLLLQKQDKKSIEFSNSDISDNEADWEKYSSFMSYDETKQYFGFEKARISYNIDVQVGNDVDTNEGDGDCGSKNQFYFQLVFADGTSGYVLANQQLSADGFRTGVKESFVISVNRDYGDLQSIHIIPENPNNQDDVFDKLKIEYIDVTRVEQSGISKTWTVEIKDWISINYSDSGAQDSIEGQSPSSESDLAQVYMVTGTGYCTNLLIAVTTKEVSASATGNISATIEYEDSNGMTKSMSVDASKAMFSYASKTVEETIEYQKTTYAMNDPTMMIRTAHTDRFVVPIRNLAKINSIVFHVVSNESYTWTIGEVNMFLVKSSGRLTINANNEYEITGEKTQLTASDSETNYTVNVKKSDYVSSDPIMLADNKVSVEDVTGSGTAKVTYYPQNQNDTLNIYVYMDEKTTPLTGYDMDCSIAYYINTEKQEDGTTITDEYKSKKVSLKTDSANYMFYSTGVKASGIVSMSSITLKSDSSLRMYEPRVKYAVIERVRSGVVIDTYNMVFLQTNASFDFCTGTPEVVQTYNNTYKQVICFELSNETVPNILTEQEDDLAVSFTYSSMTGASEHTVTSPNAFLAESGTLQIGPGGVYSMEYDMKNCTSISKINFVAMGKLAGAVNVKNAYAVIYKTDAEGNETFAGWYSFANSSGTIKNSTRSIVCTSDSKSNPVTNVAEVNIDITTSSLTDNSVGGVSCPVKLTLGYFDNDDDEQYASINDIVSSVHKGTTHTGDTISVSLLVNDFKSIRSIELEPYAEANGDITTWGVESVNVNYIVEGEEFNPARIVNDIAQEGNPLCINMSNVILKVKLFSEDKDGNTSIDDTFLSTDTASSGVSVENGRVVILTPSITGSLLGMKFECYKVVNNSEIKEENACTVSGNSSTVRSVKFSTTTAGLYKLVFSSSEFSSVKTEFYINVEEEVTTTQAATESTTDTAAAESTTLPVDMAVYRKNTPSATEAVSTEESDTLDDISSVDESSIAETGTADDTTP